MPQLLADLAPFITVHGGFGAATRRLIFAFDGHRRLVLPGTNLNFHQLILLVGFCFGVLWIVHWDKLECAGRRRRAAAPAHFPFRLKGSFPPGPLALAGRSIGAKPRQNQTGKIPPGGPAPDAGAMAGQLRSKMMT
jgi:hypothetical protein